VLLHMVEMCCLSETFTGVFLTEMLARMPEGSPRMAVESLLEDEIDHGRVGWAYLAARAQAKELDGLDDALPSMLERTVAGVMAYARKNPERDDTAMESVGLPRDVRQRLHLHADSQGRYPPGSRTMRGRGFSIEAVGRRTRVDLMPNRALELAVVVLIGGCGGATRSDPDGGEHPGHGSHEDAQADAPLRPVADRDAATGAAAPWSPVCPKSAPTQGSACGDEGLDCEYGCSNILTCSDGTWGGAVQVGGAGLCDAGPNPPGCPAEVSTVLQQTTCSASDTSCVYADKICACNSPQDPRPDAGNTWFCGPEAGCPFPRPRIGSSCAMASQQCDYAQCGSTQVCMGGVWQPTEGGCGG
jgi:hypothetical protein